jgi:hypothetical protein
MTASLDSIKRNLRPLDLALQQLHDFADNGSMPVEELRPLLMNMYRAGREDATRIAAGAAIAASGRGMLIGALLGFWACYALRVLLQWLA